MPLPTPLAIPGAITSKTLADVRMFVEHHLSRPLP
jgi:hypothetical protein